MTDHFNRRQFLLGSAATGAFLSSGCAPMARPGGVSSGDAAAAARAIYESTFEQLLTVSPELATSLGLDTGARAALKGRLSDSSYASRFGGGEAILAGAEALRRIDRRALTGRDRAWYDTALWFGERARDARAFSYGGFGGYPIPYVLSQLTGSYQSVPDFLDSVHLIETEADAQAYLDRLDAFHRNVEQEVERARADAGRGVIPPDFIIDKTLAQTRLLRAERATQQGERGAQAGLVSSLARRTREKNIAGDWVGRAGRIVNGPLAAALDKQIDLLNELRGRAGSTAGIGQRAPDGAAFYQAALRYHTSTNLTPDEAHNIGLEQVREVSSQAEALLRREGLTEGSVGARLRALGQQERFQYPNTDAGRTQIIADLNAHMTRVRSRMPEVFSASTIPTSGMEIRRVPPAIEAGAPRGYAQGGSLDGTRPGAFYINLVNTSIWPKWALPTLNHHESVPGHLWQGAIVNSAEGIPLLHRSLGIPAFGEGWGLYAESLADEIGVYNNDPLGRLGMLQSFLYRAARIVMDTGMHSKGWTRDRTIQYFIDTVGLDPISATSEVERYVVWPGQATSYKLGHNEILRIRAEARQRLGARFDLKAFHDLVLLSGDMPLEVLAGMAREWDGGAVS
jgi:uncharacterized protein (DUF885 family)